MFDLISGRWIEDSQNLLNLFIQQLNFYCTLVVLLFIGVIVGISAQGKVEGETELVGGWGGRGVGWQIVSNYGLAFPHVVILYATVDVNLHRC